MSLFTASAQVISGQRGGVKAGLVELIVNGHASLYGALLDLAGCGCSDDAGNVPSLWKRSGKRALDAESIKTAAL